jgi:hypothetical protein
MSNIEGSQIIDVTGEVDLQGGVKYVFIDPAAVLAESGPKFPANPSDFDELWFMAGGQIATGEVVTAFDPVANTGQVIVGTPPTKLNSGDVVAFRFRQTTGKWYMITGGASGGSSGTSYVAADGLTLDGNAFKFGQSVGATGNPAALTVDRELPLGGHGLSFNDGPLYIKKSGASNAVMLGWSGSITDTFSINNVSTDATKVLQLSRWLTVDIGGNLSVAGDSELYGTLNLAAHSPATASDGNLWVNGNHLYVRLAGTDFQVDQQKQNLDQVLSLGGTLTANRTSELGTHTWTLHNGQVLFADNTSNLVFGGPTSAAQQIGVIYQPANYGTTYTHGVAERFKTSFGVFDVNADGRPNVVGNFWQYNTNAGGGRENNGEAAFRFGTETHYIMGGADSYYFEFHLPELIFENGTLVRPWSWYIYKKDASSIVLNGHAHAWNFFTNSGDELAYFSLNNTTASFRFTQYSTTDNHGTTFNISNPTNGAQLIINDSGMILNANTANPFGTYYNFPSGPISITTDHNHLGVPYGLEINMDYGASYGLHLNQSTAYTGNFYPIRLDVNSTGAYSVHANTHASTTSEHGWLIYSNGKSNIRYYNLNTGGYYDLGFDQAGADKLYISHTGVNAFYFDAANYSFNLALQGTPGTHTDGNIWRNNDHIYARLAGATYQLDRQVSAVPSLDAVLGIGGSLTMGRVSEFGNFTWQINNGIIAYKDATGSFTSGSQTWVMYEPSNYGNTYSGKQIQAFTTSYGTFDVNGTPGDGTRPNIVGNFWAYNTTPGGGLISAGEFGFRYGTETHFRQPGVSTLLAEHHLPEIISEDGKFHRLWSYYIQKNEGYTFLQSQVNSFEFFNFKSGGNYSYLSWGNAYDTGITTFSMLPSGGMYGPTSQGGDGSGYTQFQMYDSANHFTQFSTIGGTFNIESVTHNIALKAPQAISMTNFVLFNYSSSYFGDKWTRLQATPGSGNDQGFLLWNEGQGEMARISLNDFKIWGTLNLAAHAPVNINDGNVWVASNHIYARLNGVTYQLDQQSTGGAVTTVFGRSGAVVATAGDYNTAQVSESGNLYFTNARSISSTLTGYTSGAGTISATDTILSAIQKLNGNFAAYVPPSAPVSSVFGRTGAVVAASGDYTTAQVTESGNLYFTNARSISSTLTGYASGAGTISASDTILSAIQKLNGNFAAYTPPVAPVSSVFGRTGAVVSTSGDYTTAQVTESGNLYHTDARTRNAVITGYVSGAGVISATDTVLTAIQKLNGNLAAYTAPVLSVFGRTGAVVAVAGDYTTSTVSEAGNLYFTNARAIAAPLTGYTSGAGTVAATDSILQAIQKLNGNVAALTTTNVAEGTNLYHTDARTRNAVLTGYASGTGAISATDTVLTAIQKLNGNLAAYVAPVTSVFGRTGAVVSATGDYTTAQVSESGNLYFTNGRAISSTLTGYTSGAGTISATDSILSAIQKLNGNFAAYTPPAAPVTSVFGRTGAVVATAGDYTTATVSESGNLYFTNARAISSTLTGYTSGAGTISATDSILSAIQKLNGNFAAYTPPAAPVSSVFGRTGAVTATSGDYNTSQVTESGNLYFTNARAIAAPLTGYTPGAGTIAATDSILQAIQKNAGNLSGLSTTNVSEGTNLYFTNARSISSTLTGYTSGAGTVSATDTVLSAIQKLNGNQAAYVAPVTSVFGRTGAVVAASGDYTTALVTESGNLYFTNARAIASALTSYAAAAGTVSATDSIIQAIQKIDGNQLAYVAPVTSVSSVSGQRTTITPTTGAVKVDVNLAGTFTWTGAHTYSSTVRFQFLTQGSIPFSSSLSAIGQDNANLYWDATNVRLGLGAGTAPARRLEVADGTNPQLRLSYSVGSVYADMQVNSAGQLVIAPTGTKLILAAATTAGSSLNIPSATSTPSAFINGDVWLDSSHLFIQIGATAYQLDQQTSGLTTSMVTEGSNLYFTNARDMASLLTGYTVPANAVSVLSSTDSVLAAFQKLQGGLNLIQSDRGLNNYWLNNASFLYGTSAAETSLYGATGSGSLTFPANYLSVGKGIQFEVSGVYNTTTLAPSLSYKIKLGSIVLLTVTPTLAASMTNKFFRISGTLIPVTTGAGTAATALITGTLEYEAGTANTRTVMSLNNLGAASAGYDSTVANIFGVTATLGTSSASNYIRANLALINILTP